MADTDRKDVFASGQVVGGYRIIRRLGKGGMAEVYEVESEKTGSPYALKVFVCEQANAIFLKKRFLAEGRLLAKLHHPRIVRVYDFGFEGPDETPYYVMDLVLNAAGRPCTLRDMLSDGATDEAQIAGWYRDLAESLTYIHGKGIVHRDVSLENVLVGPDGRAVLSDFGVSKVIDRDLRAELNLSLVTQITNSPILTKASLQLFRRVVGRTIIHHNNLKIRPPRRQHARHAFAHHLRTIICRYDDRNLGHN